MIVYFRWTCQNCGSEWSADGHDFDFCSFPIGRTTATVVCDSCGARHCVDLDVRMHLHDINLEGSE